ncbi:protein kinase domain-containing protein [Desulfobacter sp.]
MTSKNSKYIGKYQINAFLGSGSMGRVYRVTIPVLEKTAALKLFTPSRSLIKKAGLTSLRAQFIHEAAVIANIRHANVMSIWSLEETANELFYLMDYYCRNLGQLIGESYWADRPSRTVSVEKACHYLAQIIEGLCRLHEADIIHRDIKPFNIMIADTGTVKIVDFGLSKRRGDKQFLGAEKLTIGTPFYSAPEQIDSPETVDQRADLYSAGVILYRMVTGHLPDKIPALPSELNAQLDRNCDRFILKAIAPHPDDRFQTADAMSAGLKAFGVKYKNARQRECVAPDDIVQEKKTASQNKPTQIKPTLPIRSESSRILAKDARAVFNLDDLHQPAVFVENAFQRINDTTVIDHATNLVWQQSGSRYPMMWDQAQRYIRMLSESGFGGYRDWRMPTINEILSLVNPMHDDDFCMEPVFSPDQKWLWSSDTRSKKSVWTVDAQMGFVTCSDLFDYNFVKGVCSVT